MDHLLQEAMEILSEVNTLRLRGIRVWSETIERVADKKCSELATAYEEAYGKFIAAKDGTDPMRTVEAYAEQAALSLCLWHRQMNHTCRVEIALAEFVANLEGAVLWANCRKLFVTCH